MRQIYFNNRSYQVETLPSEPSLLVELVALCHDKTATFDSFFTAISKDPSLSSRVLQLTNSPAYRPWNHIIDLRQLLIVLGLGTVKQLVIASAIKQFFENFSHNFNLHTQRIWCRALVCSHLTKKIAEFIGYSKPEEAYLCGLLYQLGQLLLLLNYQQAYPELLLQFDRTNDFLQLEREQFGADHCELGAALLASWEMETFLVDAIRFQQAPVTQLQDAPQLLKMLSLASVFSSGNWQNPPRCGLERAGLFFNMTEDSMLRCFTEALEQSREMVELLGYDWDFFLDQRNSALLEPSARLVRAENTLAGQVKAIALTRGNFTAEENDIKKLLAKLRNGFGILFNLDALIFLQAEPQKRRLVPVNDLNQKLLDEVSLSYQEETSQLIKSFHARQLQKISRDCPAIGDQQLLRLLKTEFACALPIHTGDDPTGVLLLGMTNEQADFIEKNLFFVELLTSEFARAYQGFLAEQQQKSDLSMEEFSRIAHEISNPLTIIKNYLYLLGERFDQGDAAQEELSFINAEIERVGSILLRAKETQGQFGKEADPPLDINSLISRLDDILRNSLYKIANIESSLLLASGIPPLQAPADQLKQILINLIKNSVEAMTNGGLITLATRDHIYQNGQEYVEITVKDNGPGISEQVRPYLFQPVESSKPGNSGLGLSIVRKLISDLGGLIFCCSAAETGTEFQILIPRRLLPEQRN